VAWCCSCTCAHCIRVFSACMYAFPSSDLHTHTPLFQQVASLSAYTSRGSLTCPLLQQAPADRIERLEGCCRALQGHVCNCVYAYGTIVCSGIPPRCADRLSSRTKRGGPATHGRRGQSPSSHCSRHQLGGIILAEQGGRGTAERHIAATWATLAQPPSVAGRTMIHGSSGR